MTSEQLKNKLETEIAQSEYKIKNFKAYNIKAFCKRTLLKGGIAARKVAPFMLASYLVLVSPIFHDHLPFTKEVTYKGINAITMQTSNGYYEKFTSFDFEYKMDEIHYSTAFVQDEDGLYSRTETVFKMPEDFRIKYSNPEIFQISEEDMKQILTTSTTKKITKTKLEPEDFVYEKPVIIVFDSFESKEQQIAVEESLLSSIARVILYFALTAVGGLAIDAGTNLIFKHRLEKKLKKQIQDNKSLTIEEIELIKEKLVLKKENLALLAEDSPIPPEDNAMRKKASR